MQNGTAVIMIHLTIMKSRGIMSLPIYELTNQLDACLNFLSVLFFFRMKKKKHMLLVYVIPWSLNQWGVRVQNSLCKRMRAR